MAVPVSDVNGNCAKPRWESIMVSRERERERERERGRERFKNFGKKEHKMGLKISRLTKEQSFSPN